MSEFIHSILHLDQTLALWLQLYGSGVYLVIFLIIFCETGLIVLPFLPGDSLLFAAGALSAVSAQDLKIEILLPLLMAASLLGDTLNYTVGLNFGRKLFESNHRFSFLFSRKHLISTERFYLEKGKWAVSLARFFPIIRTFAPFVAGLTKMPFFLFVKMSAMGSMAWVLVFTCAGFFFGQIPFVQKNFTLLVMLIIFISLAPFLLSLTKRFLGKLFNS